MSVGGMSELAETNQPHCLLDAVMVVGSQLSLSAVSLRIIGTATKLVGALGVLDPAGTRLADFITVGIDDARPEPIGARPEGHGILGLLIREQQMSERSKGSIRHVGSARRAELKQ